MPICPPLFQPTTTTTTKNKTNTQHSSYLTSKPTALLVCAITLSCSADLSAARVVQSKLGCSTTPGRICVWTVPELAESAKHVDSRGTGEFWQRTRSISFTASLPL